MKSIALMAVCAATLAGCGATGGNVSPFLSNGNDVSFLSQGTTSCPGLTEIGTRYPLRCGPQQQTIPR